MTAPTASGQAQPQPQDGASTGPLAAEVAENTVAYWRTCAPLMPGGAFHDDGDLTWFQTDLASAPWLNQVLTTRLPVDADDRIDEMLATFGERRAPMLWSVSASDQPADLAARLKQRGLVRAGGVLTGMAIDLAALPDPVAVGGLLVERVRDAAALERWARAYVDGFSMTEDQARPFFDLYRSIGFDDDAPFRHYVGVVDGVPVASSTLFLGAGCAAIWHVGTLPAARRRGIGTAMTLAPLLDARDLGLRVGVLGSSEAGRSIYQKLGFETFGETVQFKWSPAT